MNRKQRQAAKTRGKKLQLKHWDKFEDVTEKAIARAKILRPNEPPPTDRRIYTNNKYIVQCFENKKVLGVKATKVMIRRCDEAAIHNWQDLYRIKNELFGDERVAIEVYPKKSELIDTHNFYWLWVLDA